MIAYDELLLSDGTTTIDLLSLATRTGIHLMACHPRASVQKGEIGYWHNSAIAPGRQPAAYQWDAVEEELTFSIVGWNVTDLADYAASVRNLLQAAQDYYVGRMPNAAPVYLIRRAQGETTSEYTPILAGTAPRDGVYPAVTSQYGIVSYEDWTCTIVRGEHWRDTIPGDNGPCADNAGYGCSLYHLVTELGTETYIDCGSSGTLDNLPATTITVEAWVKIEPGWGTVGIGSPGIASKFSGGTGWAFYVSQALGLYAVITYGGADAITYSGAGTVPADGTWHHYAFTYTAAVDNFPVLWLDGVQNTANTQNKGGVIDPDGAHDLWLCAWDNAGTVNYMSGAQGWTRVSDNIRYATGGGPYVVPERCVIPLDDVNAMGLWIGWNLHGPTIFDMGGNLLVNGSLYIGGVLGGLYDGVMACDCLHGNWYTDLVTDIPTIDYNCDDGYPVFMRNAHLAGNLTDIWVYDANLASWSDNLIDEIAFNLLPNPQNNDAIYFGMRERAHNYGPFFNLVFDLENISNVTGTWQFWDSTAGPGWRTLATYIAETDGTDDLQNAGVCAVAWEIQANLWIPNAPVGLVPAVMGYWIRFVCTAGAAPPPAQQNTPVYTGTWAFTEIEDTSVPGDVPALARYYGVFGTEGAAATSTFAADMVILGLRSLSRGEDFAAFLAVGNQHGPAGVTLSGQTPYGVDSIVATGTITTEACRENGLYLSCFDAGATGNFISFQHWYIYPHVAAQWYGRYRVYARARVTALNGTSRIRVRGTTTGGTWETKEYTFTVTTDRLLIDLGLISLPGFAATVEDVIAGYLILTAQCAFDNAGDYINLYDIVLIPADESILEVNIGRVDTHPIDNAHTRLDIDSVTPLRRNVRALLKDDADRVVGNWLPICAGPAWFQANADQRVWMLSAQYDGTDTYWVSNHEHLIRMRLYRVTRYQSIRGGR